METNVAVLARNVKLKSELEYLRAEMPKHVPFSGALPTTIQAFQDLPTPWQRQVNAEHPELVADLVNKQAIKEQLAEHDRQAARVAEVLADCPVKSAEAFNALSPERREEVAYDLTQDQRNALAGILPADPEGAWM